MQFYDINLPAIQKGLLLKLELLSVDTSTWPFPLCPKSPSVRGFVASLPVRLLFKYLSH